MISGKPVLEFEFEGHDRFQGTNAVCFLPDNTLLSSSRKGGVYHWNLESKEEISRWGEHLHSQHLYSVDYCKKNNLIAVGSGTGKVYLLSTKLEEVKVIPFGPDFHNVVWSVRVDETGTSLLSVCDGYFKIWDMEKQKYVVSVKTNDSLGHVLSAIFLENKDHVATGGESGNLKFWDLRSNGKTFNFNQPKDRLKRNIWDLAYQKDSGYLCSGSLDRCLRIYDIRGSRQQIQKYDEHRGCVFSVDFHHPLLGKIVATGDDCGFSRIFDLQEQKVLYKFRKSSESIYSTRFSTDGKYMGCAQGNSVFLWRCSFYLTHKESIEDEKERVAFVQLFMKENESFSDTRLIVLNDFEKTELKILKLFLQHK